MMNTRHYTGTHNAFLPCFSFSVESCTVPYSIAAVDPDTAAMAQAILSPFASQLPSCPQASGPSCWLHSLRPRQVGASSPHSGLNCLSLGSFQNHWPHHLLSHFGALSPVSLCISSQYGDSPPPAK